MDPAMDADLVALGDDAALLVGVDQRGNGRDVKCRLDVIAFEQPEDARHAHPVAELAPGKPPDRLAAVAQIAGLMVAVEGQRDRAARPARPCRRAQRPSGPHPRDELAPMLLGPLPGFEIGFGGVHGLSLGDRGSKNGRSGEIRTHDPQHPMLMRYQAALRSDRGISGEAGYHIGPRDRKSTRLNSSHPSISYAV